MPSCYVGQGLTVAYTDHGRQFSARPTAAWFWRGEPFPFNYGYAPETEDPAEQDSALATRAERQGPFIPVEETDAPLVMISGGDDQLWPSATYGRRAVERLESADPDFPYDHLSYEDAGHSIGVPYTPTATGDDPWLAMGGTPAGDARAEADSWPRVLETLDGALE